MKNDALIIVTRKLPDTIETRMMELFNVRLNVLDLPFTRMQMVEAVRSARVLVPTVTDIIDREVIREAGTDLRLIASFGTGTDHIDLRAARERSILVSNTPDVLTEDTADMTIALILAVARRISEGERLVRSGRWIGWSPTSMLGRRIKGKRLGIIGMGRIGQAVARRALAFGLKIHYHNRRRLSEEREGPLEATYWSDLERMLPRIDILSLNCPRTPATFHLLSARRLQLLHPRCIIINTSRGDVIDEKALTRMLIQGDLAGAGLDVFEHEPAVDSNLLRLDNVVLLPHIGSATIEGRLQMGERVLVNIRAFMDGHTLPDRVIEERYTF